MPTRPRTPNDGVRRRVDSCSPTSSYLRHRVRRRWRVWEDIGASGPLLDWIRHGIRLPFRHGRPPPSFHHGVSLWDATPEQLDFLDSELARFVQEGHWEAGTSSQFVSRCFLVPKAGGGWRLVIDLRFLNKFFAKRSMKMETLKHLRHIARKGDYWISFDLKDGFYALAIAPEDRQYFTVNIRGQLFQLAGLPMGWTLSPWYFGQLTSTFVRYFRRPVGCPPAHLHGKSARRWVTRHQGARLLPFVDDFAAFRESFLSACLMRDRIFTTLDDLGLEIHPTKGFHEPVQVGEHLGLIVDSQQGEFRAPEAKLSALSSLAKTLLFKASAGRRWLPAKMLARFAGKAQFLYLAIPPARFYLRELHDVLAAKTSWASSVKMSKQLRRDLLWWVSIPSQHNGRSIFKPVETAYLHCDSSSFGWGAVLNGVHEARGFWTGSDRLQHITLKELKAVRLAVLSFLRLLRGRRLLLHEDNQAVVSVLTHLTSRSPALMTELRKLWLLLDSNDIHIRTRYIRSAANIWADALSRERDKSDWQLSPRLFAFLNLRWGPHTVDRFASLENTQLPRYNSKWLDPKTEAVDSLRLPAAAWRAETNWCNPPWELLDDLVLKLRCTGAAATVIAPHWPGKPWHQQLSELASEAVVYPPSFGLFRSGLGGRVEVGAAGWSVSAFRVPFRHGST